MSELWVDRQRTAWRGFLDKVQERAHREAEIRTGFADRTAAIDQDYQSQQAQFESDFQASLVAWEKKKIDTLDQLRGKYDGALDKARAEYQAVKQKAADDYAAERAQLEADFKESRWTIGTVREADNKNSQDQLHQQQQDAGNQIAKIEHARRQAVEVLATWTLEVDDQAPPANPPKNTDVWQELQSHVAASSDLLNQMKAYGLPKQIIGSRPFLLMGLAAVVLAAAVGAGVYFATSSFVYAGLCLLAAPAIVFPVGVAVRNSLHRKMEEKAEELWLKMEQALVDAKVAKAAAAVAAGSAKAASTAGPPETRAAGLAIAGLTCPVAVTPTFTG